MCWRLLVLSCQGCKEPIISPIKVFHVSNWTMLLQDPKRLSDSAVANPFNLYSNFIVQIAENYQLVPPSELNRPDFSLHHEGCDWVQNWSVFKLNGHMVFLICILFVTKDISPLIEACTLNSSLLNLNSNVKSEIQNVFSTRKFAKAVSEAAVRAESHFIKSSNPWVGMTLCVDLRSRPRKSIVNSWMWSKSCHANHHSSSPLSFKSR